jgi:RNA polymerase sigma factor (sigma-70 family)
MATSGTGAIIQHLRRMVLRVDEAGMTDGQLLEEFVSHRDAAAFESLVRRHGPMVLGVCRRILRDPHDAEDAFQSTFLVLARKAAPVSPRELVGNWLYGVAQTTAIRLRATNAKRRLRERQVADMPEPEAMPKDRQDDLRQLLDEELARLPDKFRVPIVLCDLEDRTRREVARQLKLPEGTLSSRLTMARRMLAKRLARHGLAISGGTLATALSQSATSACVSVSLVSSTVKAATLAAAGQIATGLISAPVAALTEGVLKAMFLTKVKTVMGVTLMVASLCGAAGLIYQTQAAEQREATKATEKADQEKFPAVGKNENPKPDKQPAPKDDMLAIRGTWRVISVQHHSEGDTDEEATRWEGSQWKINAYGIDVRWEEGRVGFNYKLDPSRKPKKLDLQILGRTIPALYALEGDVLQIRLGFHARTRPKSLTAEDDGNTVLLILKREHIRKPEALRVSAGAQNQPPMGA